MIYFDVLKTWQEGHPNLAHGTKSDKIRTTKKQKPSSSEEAVRAIVYEGSLEERSEITAI